MRKLKQTMVAGIQVFAYPEKVRSISTDFYDGNHPAQVSLRMLNHSMPLTPDEARTLSRMLSEAADVAEKSS